MKKILPLFFLILFFLALKISSNSVHLSDTNIYFNIAYQISQGKILYQDIFFSNFPFFSYVASLYYFLSNQNLELFYFTSAIEVAAITSLIYLIVYQKTKSHIASMSSSALYSLSFIVLSTSDHQTGVFTASLLAVLSYFFLQKNKIILSGIFIATTILTKAYFLPIFISFLVFIALKKEWRNLLKFGLASTAAGLLILLPFLILAPGQLISDIFGFSLTRPAGSSKMELAWFFIAKDFLFFILIIFNLINIKKNLLFGLISIFSLLFFFGYQDVYYLYLNFLAPFLCLSFYELSGFLKTKFKIQRLVVPTILSFFVLLSLVTYIRNYRNFEKIENIKEVISVIKTEKPDFLYGVNDITPGLIALTKIPALENVNDAHKYFFDRKIYDKKILTDKAVKSKTIVITHGADYPEYNIKQDILDDIFVKETIYKNCKNILSVPVILEGAPNRINLFKCY